MNQHQYVQFYREEEHKLLTALIYDWESGISVRYPVSADDFREDLQPWYRRYLAARYNKLAERLKTMDAARFINDVGIPEMRKAIGYDESLIKANPINRVVKELSKEVADV